MEINKIGFATRILRAAPASGTALPAAQRSKPTTEKITLTTKEIIAEVHIPYDVLEDNIERGTLEDTIMDLIAERASLDLEELIILGDTGSADTYLALADGVLAQAVSHVVDYTANPQSVTKAIFKAALKAMPNKYLRNRSAMRHFVSPHAEIEYADSLANRETPLGDQKVTGWMPNYAYGVPVQPAALMPNSKAIFTYPKNLIFGVQRQMMIETDRDIRARVLIVVLTMRIDIKFEEEDAVVKVDGISTDEETSTTT
jgi:HK97 family phage major capsid protein